MELHHELFHYFFSGPCFPIIIYEDDRYLSSSLMEIVTSRTISFFLQRSLFSHHHFWRRPVPVVIADGVRYVTNCFIISSEVPVFPSSFLRTTATYRRVWWSSLRHQLLCYFFIEGSDGDCYDTNYFVMCSEVPVFASSFPRAIATSPACPPGAWCWSGPTRSWMTPV